MAVLFHQNMRRFGGAAPVRNAHYNAAFGQILAALGAAAPVAVAGFTEVCNNGAAATAFGPAGVGGGLCAALGVNHIGNIACGQTALAGGPEYIAIGVNVAYPVVSVGRIFLNSSGCSISLIHDISPAIPLTAVWCNQVPSGATPDYRGLVYVVIAIAGVNVAVGFLHNLYTLEAQRILVMGQLPHMMNMMGNAIPGIAAKYIGGDFNVQAPPPPYRRGTARIGYIYLYSNGLAGAPLTLAGVPGLAVPPPAPPPPPPFTALGTTWAGNLYDYWFSTIDPAPVAPAPPVPLILPAPGLHGITLDTAAGAGAANQMSDHCAIILQIT
ncbi:MAG: hypothetical protein ACK47N_20285 [Microcystis sp.]|uniref:hypothetical protein n=1 Tax=Microcystis sp. TaxID=1127 RepID=UPI00391A8CB6